MKKDGGPLMGFDAHGRAVYLDGLRGRGGGVLTSLVTPTPRSARLFALMTEPDEDLTARAPPRGTLAAQLRLWDTSVPVDR